MTDLKTQISAHLDNAYEDLCLSFRLSKGGANLKAHNDAYAKAFEAIETLQDLH